MSKPDVCQCNSNREMSWQPSPCNEEGWICQRCRGKAPGEPPGYRPDLDRDLIDIKVENILMDLTIHDLVYMSNSTDGDCCVRSVIKECRGTGYHDQYSIIAAIMNYANRTHAEYWKAQGDAVRAGKDRRERCACGKLATCWGGGQPPRCSDCAMDRGLGLFAAEPRDPSEPGPFPDDPWDAYGIWEAKYRRDHPLDDEDDRDSLALIEIYARTPIEELRAIWDAERARRDRETDR